MKVGMVGLGKLGLPVATAMALRGHRVLGYDVDPRRMSYGPKPEQEAGPAGDGDYNDVLYRMHPAMTGVPSRLSFESLEVVVALSEIVFVAVPTPHDPRFDGSKPFPTDRADFDYSHLKEAVSRIAALAQPDTVIAIISTVLPGTMRREIEPLCAGRCRLVYNPSFISSGTTMRDFLEPEFVLIGARDLAARERMTEFYVGVWPGVDHLQWREDFDLIQMSHERPPFVECSFETAEVVKVAYNFFGSMKIAFANTMMELCHRIGANVDHVTNALSLATRRLLSPAYLRGGMGDGGACHPRDLIAMSWLARSLQLSYDLFDSVAEQRQAQTEWLASRIKGFLIVEEMPVVLLGKTFKRGTRLTTGSPALLLSDALTRIGVPHAHWDPVIDGPVDGFTEPAIFFVATRHPEFAELPYPAGSIVLDPFGYVPDREGVNVIRIGRDQ